MIALSLFVDNGGTFGSTAVAKGHFGLVKGADWEDAGVGALSLCWSCCDVFQMRDVGPLRPCLPEAFT